MITLLARATLPLTLALGVVAGAMAAGAPALAQQNAGDYLAGRQAQISGDLEQAATSYARALTRDPNNVPLMEATLSARLALGDVERAAVVARQLNETATASQAGDLVLMGTRAQDGDWEGILTALDAGGSVGPLFDGLARGWALVGLGRADDALAAFDAVIEQRGVKAFGQYHKALALALLGRYGAADALLANADALQLTRRGIQARLEFLSQDGQTDAALALLDDSFDATPDTKMQSIRASLEAGETLDLTMARDATAGFGEIYFSIAGALNGEAEPGYALLYTRMAQYLRPGDVDATLLAASLLDAMKQYDLAITAYRSVPRDDFTFDAAELGRAETMVRAGRVDAAIEVLEQLATLRPDVPMIQVTLGDALRGEERFAAARAAYDKAVDLLPDDQPGQWFVYFARGITHERSGDFDSAEADFRRALELNPEQPQVLNYLGYSYVEKGRNLDEALDMIERAVAARPDSGYIVDSLGWAFYKLGRYDDAVEPMERAVSLMPVDPVVNDHLGDVLWMVGRRLEAQFQWRRALSFAEDDNPDVTDGLEPDRIRRKLEVGLDKVLADEAAAPADLAEDG